jgi:hypothetical protein
MQIERKPVRWTSHDDELFRELANSGATAEVVAEALNRKVEEIIRRGYMLGLPRKWFRSRLPADHVV